MQSCQKLDIILLNKIFQELTKFKKILTFSVIHISFSHDGKNFVACSKDRSFSVWQLQQDGTFLDVHRKNMSSFGWLQAFSSRFSPNDKRLLVCGVTDTDE